MSEVPQGTVNDVLCWVDDDPARAQEALDAERAGQNRSTLIAQLEPIAAKEATDVSETTDETTYDPNAAEGTQDPNAADETGFDPNTSASDEPNDELAPGAEQPVEVEIDPRDEGVVVLATQARDADVEVPDEPVFGPPGNLQHRTALTTTGTERVRLVAEGEDDPDDLDVITGEQVEYVDAALAPNGMAIAFNGQAFMLNKQVVGMLKQAVDKAVVGLAL